MTNYNLWDDPEYKELNEEKEELRKMYQLWSDLNKRCSIRREKREAEFELIQLEGFCAGVHLMDEDAVESITVKHFTEDLPETMVLTLRMKFPNIRFRRRTRQRLKKAA